MKAAAGELYDDALVLEFRVLAEVEKQAEAQRSRPEIVMNLGAMFGSEFP